MKILKNVTLICILLGLALMVFGCSENQYTKRLKMYEMQLAEGRDQAFYAAMEMTKLERLDVEDQFARQGLENALMISAFVRATGKTPEQLKTEKVFSYDEVLKIIDARNEVSDKRKAEILEAYRNFFKKIDEEDIKIKAIQEGVRQIEEVRQETYQKVGETLGTALATTGVIAATQ